MMSSDQPASKNLIGSFPRECGRLGRTIPRLSGFLLGITTYALGHAAENGEETERVSSPGAAGISAGANWSGNS